MFRTQAMAMAMALAMAASATAGPALAGQVAKDRVEKAQDRRELRQDARQLRDDRLDQAKLEATLTELDRVRAAPAPGALAAVDQRVMELLRKEAVETRVEVGQKANEVRRDNVEVRGDAREIRRDAAQGAPLKAAGDVRDIRDDRRDRRDDRRDLGKEVVQASRRYQIATEYRGLVGREDPGSQDRKRALLVELVGIARAELRGDRQELREDRRELREDRRELREDRRERR